MVERCYPEIDAALKKIQGAQRGAMPDAYRVILTLDDLNLICTALRAYGGVAQAPLGPCTQAELDAFEGLDRKSKQLFSSWVDRARKAEAALALSSTRRVGGISLDEPTPPVVTMTSPGGK